MQGSDGTWGEAGGRHFKAGQRQVTDIPGGGQVGNGKQGHDPTLLPYSNSSTRQPIPSCSDLHHPSGAAMILSQVMEKFPLCLRSTHKLHKICTVYNAGQLTHVFQCRLGLHCPLDQYIKIHSQSMQSEVATATDKSSKGKNENLKSCNHFWQ